MRINEDYNLKPLRSTDSSFTTASAPGRLDVMGGIADYSGSLVLQMPIREETVVGIRLRDDYQCVLQSETNTGEKFAASVDYRKFLLDSRIEDDFARQQFNKNKSESWIAYVVGSVMLLQKERGIDFRGADFNIHSSVPIGKGVSSSASLEVATMKALGKVFHLSFSGTELPTLAQKVENNIVGAPCGLMDQLTSYFGEPRKLLPIVCQPDIIRESIPLPTDVFFMGIDSGIRHSVGGASYSDVRCAAFMGYSIIALAAGAQTIDIQEGIRLNDFSNLPYGGFLCNIPVSEFENQFKKVLPDRITGKDFLSHYGPTIDRVTTIKEDTSYSVYPCTAHPIYENERVHQFMKHLLSFGDSTAPNFNEILLSKMGALMDQSHKSYSHCGLGSDRTDEIVSLAKERGIFGAKITGGGSGGTVCLLASGQHGKNQVHDLHRYFSEKYRGVTAIFET